MIAWGQKSKPQKIPAASNNQNPKKPLDQNLTPKNPMPNFRGLKNSRGTTQPGYLGTITESSYCFEYPKESLLKSSHPKNTCQNFVPKEIPKSKISNPKNPSIIPVTWNPESPPGFFFNTVLTWPLDSSLSALWLVSHADVLRGSSCVATPLTSAKFLKVQSALIRSGSLLWLVYVFSAQISRYSSGAGTRDVGDEPPRTSAWEATLWLLWQ